MRKLLTGFAAAAAVTFAASVSIACDLHDARTASTPPAPDVVAMSTHDGTPPVIVESDTPAEPAATSECGDGDENCAAESE